MQEKTFIIGTPASYPNFKSNILYLWMRIKTRKTDGKEEDVRM